VEKGRSNNISDFLVRDTEITIDRRSNFGDSGDIISIRGMDTKRIQLNIDGRDISSTGVVGGNYLDFGTIPLDNIESIEIIKGGSSIEHGNSALGGVINARTRKPANEPHLSVYATMGGWRDFYDFHNVRGAYAQKLGPLGFSLGLSHQANDAYFRNNDFELFHVNPRLYLETPWGGELTFSYNYSRAKRGLIITNRDDGIVSGDGDPFRPGWDRAIDSRFPVASGESFAGGSQTPAMYVLGEGAHWVKQRHLIDLGYNQRLGETGFLELLFFRNYETRRERNYADVEARLLHQTVTGDTFNPALTRDGDLVMDKSINVDRSYGLKLKSGVELGAHKLVAGADYEVRRSGGQKVFFVDTNYNVRRQGGQSVGTMTGSGNGEPSLILGAYLGDHFRINDSFALDLGVRYDGFEARNRQANGSIRKYRQGGVSPKAMLTWTINDEQAASLAVYRNMRSPAANEYGWFVSAADPAAGGTLLTKVEGTNLRMEEAYGVDLAYKRTFGADGFVKISAWYYDVHDYINMRSGLPQSERSLNSPGTGGNLRTSYNMDAWMRGLTVSGSWRAAEPLVIDASLTWQENKKSNDMFDPLNLNDSIEYIPAWKANLGLAWTISDRATLDAFLLAVGKRHYYFSAGNNQYVGHLGAYATLGASLSYKLGGGTTMEIYADNLSGTDYEERWGYPAMGLNAGVSLKWEL
jgi:iron complex outermembrane receptor protein